MLGRRFVIALRTSLARSFSTYCFSGSGAESVISQSASLSLLLCAGTSRELRLFRKIISAELIPMRVNQVEKVDRPSKLWRWRNALRNASWTASSASSWLRVTRRTVQKSFCASAPYHVSSVPISPLLTVAASFMPLIRFLAFYRCSPCSPSESPRLFLRFRARASGRLRSRNIHSLM